MQKDIEGDIWFFAIRAYVKAMKEVVQWTVSKSSSYKYFVLRLLKLSITLETLERSMIQAAVHEDFFLCNSVIIIFLP